MPQACSGNLTEGRGEMAGKPEKVPSFVRFACSELAWVLFVCVALWPAILSAQKTGAHIILGKVAGPDGRGVQVRVVLQNEIGVEMDETYSNLEGRFNFRYLEKGSYLVVVDDPSYRRAEARAEFNTTSLVASVYISLKPRASPEKRSPPFESGSSTVSINELRTKFPKKAVKQYEKGNASLQRGDAQGAIPHFEKALELAPDMYPVLNNLGNAYLQTRQMDRAEATLRKAIAADPAAVDPLVNLGHLYYETQKYGQAEEVLLRGLTKDPQATLAYFFLGLTYVRQGKLPAAIQNLQKSLIGGDPRVAQAHLILANLFMSSREFAKAREHLETYLKIRPADPQADHIREVLSQLRAESNP